MTEQKKRKRSKNKRTRATDKSKKTKKERKRQKEDETGGNVEYTLNNPKFYPLAIVVLLVNISNLFLLSFRLNKILVRFGPKLSR